MRDDDECEREPTIIMHGDVVLLVQPRNPYKLCRLFSQVSQLHCACICARESFGLLIWSFRRSALRFTFSLRHSQHISYERSGEVIIHTFVKTRRRKERNHSEPLWTPRYIFFPLLFLLSSFTQATRKKSIIKLLKLDPIRRVFRLRDKFRDSRKNLQRLFLIAKLKSDREEISLKKG